MHVDRIYTAPRKNSSPTLRNGLTGKRFRFRACNDTEFHRTLQYMRIRSDAYPITIRERYPAVGTKNERPIVENFRPGKIWESFLFFNLNDF